MSVSIASESSPVSVAPTPAPATASAPASASLYWPMTVFDAKNCDLSYMDDSHSESNLRDGLCAVARTNEQPETKQKEINAWEYLSTYSPPLHRGFMFSYNDEIVDRVQKNMEAGHSGCSWAWTMRHIEFIAKNGLAGHREMWLKR